MAWRMSPRRGHALMVNSEGNYTCKVSNLDGVDTQTSMVFCKCLYSKRNAMKFVPKIGSYATFHWAQGKGRGRGWREVWGISICWKCKKGECKKGGCNHISNKFLLFLDRQGQVQVGISKQTGATLLQGAFPINQVFTVSEGDQFQLCVEIIEGRVQQEGVVVFISSINGSAFSE